MLVCLSHMAERAKIASCGGTQQHYPPGTVWCISDQDLSATQCLHNGIIGDTYKSCEACPVMQAVRAP